MEFQSELQRFVLLSDDGDLELKRSVSYNDVESRAEVSTRVYEGPADVTARFVLVSTAFSPSSATVGGPKFVAHPAGPTGATGVLPLGDSQAVSITVSRASDAEQAVQLAENLAAQVQGGAGLGFGEGGIPTTSIGEFDVVGWFDKGSPTARRDQVVQVYQDRAGRDLTVRQEALVDGDQPFDLAVMGLDTPTEYQDGYEFVWQPGGNGVVSTLIAKRDSYHVSIHGAGTKEIATRVMQSLQPVEVSKYARQVDDAFTAAIAALSPQRLSDDFVAYSDAVNPTVVCRAAAQPSLDSCGWALSESPLIAAVPEKAGNTVIYCSSQQAVEVVNFNGAEVDTSKQACGVFATSLVTKRDLTIDTVIDGFASTDTFALGSAP